MYTQALREEQLGVRSEEKSKSKRQKLKTEA
jgi:hypothetical protein